MGGIARISTAAGRIRDFPGFVAKKSNGAGIQRCKEPDMTARITLILTLLLSTLAPPVCRCHAAIDETGTLSKRPVPGCSHCCDGQSNSLSCPARPDCCCRSNQNLMLAESQDSESELAARALPNGSDVAREHSGPCLTRIRSGRVLMSAYTLTDSGGRVLLMRTRRLRI